MYLYPRGSRHWDWLGTTAYLGPRVAAEWAQGVHLGYALLCGWRALAVEWKLSSSCAP